MGDRERRHPRIRVAVVAGGIAVVCAALAVVAAHDPSFEARLNYSRPALATGAAYRLATAHLVHLSTSHAILDIAALVLIAWIFAAELTARRLLTVTLAALVTIDAGLWFLHPEVERYAGLSGLLHGWFAAGAFGWCLAGRRDDAFLTKRVWGIVLLASLVIKLTLEQRGQSFWLAADPLPVVTSAHRWGAAAGVLCAASGRALDVVFRRRGARADGAS